MFSSRSSSSNGSRKKSTALDGENLELQNENLDADEWLENSDLMGLSQHGGRELPPIPSQSIDGS